MNVLVIMAHPDDCEISISGTLLKHRYNKDEILIVCATEGEALAKERRNETKKAAMILKAKVIFLGLPDRKIKHEIETISRLEEVINKFNPDRIYTHSLSDTHQDHLNLGRSAVVAGRHVKQILLFVCESTTINFHPTFFVDISNHIEEKLEIVHCHKTVMKLNKSYIRDDVIVGQAFYRGSQIETKYAECFEVFKFVDL